jgi:oligopeptide/dipeptide ABC transporter ATP-binding protein
VTAKQVPLLQVENLHVHFQTLDGLLKAVDGVSFTLEQGKCLGIVGESGCGKSVAARSILRLLPSAITSGQILYLPKGADRPIDLAKLPSNSAAIRRIRGGEIAMIFQEPMTSLTPVYTVGEQIMESIRLHQGLAGAEARRQAVAMLDLVGIPDSSRRLDDYPHQMSGGMRQRVAIAIALACRPRILIADEPTTALDVTIQAQILDLLKDLQAQLHMALIMISHDLAVISQMADEILVMYLGQAAERAAMADFFRRPRHPYSQGLARSIIDLETAPKEFLPSIVGSVPSPLHAPSGCRFRNRCEFVHDRCGDEPPVYEVGAQHMVKCWLYEEEASGEHAAVDRPSVV